MTRKTGLLMMPLSIIALLLIIFDFTPRAATESKQRVDAASPSQSISKAGYRSPANRHKVQVNDAMLARQIAARGGRLIGDYDTYQIIEVDTGTMQSLASEPFVTVRDEDNLVLLNAGAIDTTGDEAQGSRAPVGAFEGKRMHLVQFAGPVKSEWYRALSNTGAQIVTYIPHNAYLVYGDAKSLQAVQRLSAAAGQWDSAYTSRQRLDSSLTSEQRNKAARSDGARYGGAANLANLSAAGHELFAVQLVADETENAKTLAIIDDLKLEPMLKRERVLHYVNVVAALSAEMVDEIANRADVVSIQPWAMPKKLDERQNQIIAGNLTGDAPTPGDYLAYLAGKGFSFSAANFGVNVSDSGLDNATTTPNHFALYTLGDAANAANSRVVYSRLEGRANVGSTLQGCDGHGNINTHIIGGYVPTGTINGVNFSAAPHADAQGFRYGLGVAPFVKLGSSVIFDPTNFTNPNYFNLEARAYNNGMRISSNSWGADSSVYNIDAQQYDALVRDAQQPNSVFPTAGNQEYVIVFAAGNAGSGAGTVAFPSTAKNVITVGAAENFQSFGGSDGCGVGDAGANNVNDIANFSARGPTADGRRKPDIMAPGTHITGGLAQASIANPAGSGSGSRNSCFNGGGVCGGVGSFYYPAGQQYYTASSGTSHSTPAIAGAAALLRQHFLNRNLAAPSPALTKGLMMNSARYMTGAGANDTLPSNNQGMGELSLNNYFDIFETANILRDQVAADTFTASGQERIITGNVPDNTKPFRVTLVWTDAPGPTSGNAFVNNLDLEVSSGGQIYRGNVFNGATAATGGAADARNNVESVFLPAGAVNNFTVRVKGTNIAGNGVPGTGGPLDQDYALIIYNGDEAPAAVINAGAANLAAESCAPGNNAIDPDETVTINFSLSNVGAGSTTNLVATLLPTGGVNTTPGNEQSYGALGVGDAPVARPFTFIADINCGQLLTATLGLRDGAVDLGTVTYTLRTGALGAAVLATYTGGNTATPIPDVSAVDIPINITDTGEVQDVNVKVRLNHTYDGDLVLNLIAPDGTSVPLVQNRGDAGRNFGSGINNCAGTFTVFDDSATTAIASGLAPFAGTYRPESPLSAFNGSLISGVWKLNVVDTGQLDVGSIGCVQLEITRRHFVCCGVPATPQIVSGGNPLITAESVAPANNAPDPGETVTTSFPLVNIGNGDTSNLVATLLSSGGVTPVGNATRAYGSIASGGPPASQFFTFTTAGACGSDVTATIALSDGAMNLGMVAYTFRLGAQSTLTVLDQNFDTVSPPTLPTGWTPTHTGGVSDWATSGVRPDTALNSAFAPNHPFVSSIELTTPPIAISSRAAQFTFRNAYNLEDEPSSTGAAYDGMVLEIKIGAGSFTDILDAGGEFVAGGYTRIIASGFASPIAGRSAWSGLSAGTNAAPGYVTTTVNLPPAAAGENIWLRWRVASDQEAVAPGSAEARIDTVTITDFIPACSRETCSLICPADINVAAAPGQNGAIVDYPNPSVTGTCDNIVSSPASGTFFPSGTTTVSVSTGAGPSCSFNVTVAPPLASSTLVISEFRLRGALGALDEYVEIANLSDAPFTVASGDGSGGWSIAALDASGTNATVVAVIPDNTIIPARGHYLIANNTPVTGYSLGDYGGIGKALPNAAFTEDIPDNTGIGLFNTGNPANLNMGTRIDAVGFTGQAGTPGSLFSEGGKLPGIGDTDGEYAFVRKQTSGLPKDSGDNALDFDFVSTDAGIYGGVQSLPGAPGPENLGSPAQRNATLKASLIDPGCNTFGAAGSACARHRDGTPDAAHNSTFGTLSLRRKFTNRTTESVARLRFRIVDITAGTTAASATADLRARSSLDFVATCTDICPDTGFSDTTIHGVTLETPAGADNGGINSTLAQGDITLDSKLAPGASTNVYFLLGVERNGSFRFLVNVEAETVPVASPNRERSKRGGGQSGGKATR
ncbi:MAG: S8 family serine peptidase [Pyrinomonadaceae bacterium]